MKLSVVKGLTQRVKKVLKNRFVEKLVVKGPCNLNLVPVMENLKEVEIIPDSLPGSCTYWRSKQDDRILHRNGLCCVNLGTMFKKCPHLEKFVGLEVGNIPKDTFIKWNLKLKKVFYQDYLHQGGTKEFKTWVKNRWFTRKQVILPVEV